MAHDFIIKILNAPTYVFIVRRVPFQNCIKILIDLGTVTENSFFCTLAGPRKLIQFSNRQAPNI